nr:amidohydrolase family protein [uncultured Butyricicoccus sp.]
MNNFALKGDILFSRTPTELAVFERHYAVCIDGVCAGVFSELPERFAAIPVLDYTGKLIIPGLVDLHAHAPQYAFRALDMDLELLDWLDTQTFPQEARYADLGYAQTAYTIFADALRRSATTRAVLFGTLHVPATRLLMELLEQSGLETYVGKVNMNRNSPDCLCESDAATSLAATRDWLDSCRSLTHCRPILTPRFVPSCSDALMQGLGDLQRETGLPVQSHLSENQGEIAWVRELCPQSTSYGDAYDRFGLFGGDGCPTIMAHCVWSDADERALMKRNGVFIAHCPQSNTNLSSGIAPVRTFLREGLSVGLGSDIAGGVHLSILRAMADAVQVSKLRWRLCDQSLPPLTLPEAFFLGTRGGGAFFGKVGAFEPGYAFDALVLDDADLPCPFALTPEQRLTRIIYLSDDHAVQHKFVDGRKLF